MNYTTTIIIIFLFLSCSTTKRTNVSDSLLMKQHESEIKKYYLKTFEHVENSDSMTTRQIDSIFYQTYTDKINFLNGQIIYSPDEFFKIIQVQWKVLHIDGKLDTLRSSFIHFNLKKKETVVGAGFTEIDTIYKLHPNRYLIIEKSWSLPIPHQVESERYCLRANLISFTKDTIAYYPGKNKDPFDIDKTSVFGIICTEAMVKARGDSLPYIRFVPEKKLLKYCYGRNYTWTDKIDTDTIKQGQYKYVNGEFIFEKESVVGFRPH